MTANDDTEDLYKRLISAWNDRDAEAMSALFSPTGIMIGFDGSLVTGAEAVREHLTPIFGDHPTAAYVTIVRSVQPVGDSAILLLADAGMVPPGHSEIHAEANARQTLIASELDGRPQISLFQNTPAALHWDEAGRDALTAELNAVVSSRGWSQRGRTVTRLESTPPDSHAIELNPAAPTPASSASPPARPLHPG